MVAEHIQIMPARLVVLEEGVEQAVDPDQVLKFNKQAIAEHLDLDQMEVSVAASSRPSEELAVEVAVPAVPADRVPQEAAAAAIRFRWVRGVMEVLVEVQV